jgi:hypothetical protein
MESLTSAQAAGLLYAFFWLMMITSTAWMTLVMVGMGIHIELISLGSVASFQLRRSGPKVVIGLFPGASVGTSEDPGQRERLNSTACKILHGGGQVLLWLVAAVLLAGPTAALDHFLAAAAGFIPATFSPWHLGPEVLRTFWAHLQVSPRDGLAVFAAACAWMHLFFNLFTVLHRYEENPEGLWARLRVKAPFVPIFFFFPWVVAFVRAIYLAFAA